MTQKHPLAEVFGFRPQDMSAEAARYRKKRLCPFNNRVPNCTKDKANDPLGVCSIYENGDIAVTCPVRFRQDWLIADHAAEFFFPPDARWTSLTEVRLNDKHGRSAGNIDVVLVSYDDRGRVTDFGCCEIQAVYISGNVREPFAHYMERPASRHKMDWTGKPNYPRPDYLSSSRKRLAPQLLFKGQIISGWGKKLAVVVHRGFFEALPSLPRVDKDKADMVWLVYEVRLDKRTNRYNLTKHEAVHTKFAPTMRRVTDPKPGQIRDFVDQLQTRLDAKLNHESPDAPTLADIPLTEPE